MWANLFYSGMSQYAVARVSISYVSLLPRSLPGCNYLLRDQEVPPKTLEVDDGGKDPTIRPKISAETDPAHVRLLAAKYLKANNQLMWVRTILGDGLVLHKEDIATHARFSEDEVYSWHHGTHLGHEVFIKKVRVMTQPPTAFFHEVDFLSRAGSDSVLRFHGACFDPELACIVYGHSQSHLDQPECRPRMHASTCERARRSPREGRDPRVSLPRCHRCYRNIQNAKVYWRAFHPS